MYQSFFVYISFGLILCVLGFLAAVRQKHDLQYNKKSPFLVWEIMVSLLVFAFVSGVRWNVGKDHLEYLNNYLNIQNGGASLFSKELGFEFVTKIFANSGLHFSYYFGFLAFLQIFFIYRAFKDQRFLYPFIGVVIIFGTEYLSWMNGIRQMIAATMFVYSIQFIQKRKLIQYFVTILLASLFHTSALLLLIFYFVPQKDYFKNRSITLTLVACSLILGNLSFWTENLTNLSQLLEFLGYNWYSDNIEVLIEDNEIRNIGPRRLVMIIVPLFVIWYGSKLKLHFKNTYFLTYYNLAIMGFVLYNMFANMHHGFIRPITYLTIFSVPTTAYLLFYFSKKRAKDYVVFMFFLAVVLSYLPLSIITDFGKEGLDYSNYKFYWYNHR